MNSMIILDDIFLLRRCFDDKYNFYANLESISNQELTTDILYNIYLGSKTEISRYDDVKNRENCNFLYLINNLINETEIKNSKINILDIYGSFSGKSKPSKNLSSFSSTLEICCKKIHKKFSGRTIYFQDLEDFTTNISILEKRFDKIDVFHFTWNNRYFICNSDCSHTIGAIYRQAKEQKLLYQLKCNIKKYEIKSDIYDLLKKEWVCYIFKHDGVLINILSDLLANSFFNSSQSYHVLKLTSDHSLLVLRRTYFNRIILFKILKNLELENKIINIFTFIKQ